MVVHTIIFPADCRELFSSNIQLESTRPPDNSKGESGCISWTSPWGKVDSPPRALIQKPGELICAQSVRANWFVCLAGWSARVSCLIEGSEWNRSYFWNGCSPLRKSGKQIANQPGPTLLIKKIKFGDSQGKVGSQTLPTCSPYGFQPIGSSRAGHGLFSSCGSLACFPYSIAYAEHKAQRQ